ncbi:NAD(P)H-binding protein [Streptomyces pristinaespiralis]|uniref:NmrA family transcriptional regulator n=1 Tax=Streptomyces pristinaespiralis TaxID=38300 RepID=A0A0M4D2A3_STRPR|nr:NAD(P)H-binding protein [Streptomyces pristinaespiralis]ALC19754.1 NmrA family transcriptional regulator [Streptomyces pristinaespiralis]QMU17267.1 NAD(P)H-binding protein [Streptomyces pristinaespiralis]
MILVTGAAGALGTLIAQRLGDRDDTILGTRDPGQLQAPLPVRRLDFDEPRTLVKGFEGVDVLLLISAGYGEDDTVIARHRAALDAAEKSGVRHVVYTSLTAAGDHLPYALPHRWTERRIQESTMDWTILRNGLYAELLARIAAPSADGRITAPLGEGRLAAVARADLADAAVRVTVEASAHAGRVYELVGEQAVGGADLARAHGPHVTYEPETLARTRARIAAGGAEPFQVPMLVGTCSAVAAGFLSPTGGDLRRLLGRAPRCPLAAAVAQCRVRQCSPVASAGTVGSRSHGGAAGRGFPEAALP